MPKRGNTVWYARFLYKNFLYGEWTRIDQERPMFPNPEYKDQLVNIEFKEVPVRNV